MKLFKLFIVSLYFLLPYSLCLAESPYARVAALRGAATMNIGGDSRQLMLEEEVPSGATIITETRSFVRLVMGDGSYLNIAPATRISLEKNEREAPDSWELVKGRIRSRILNQNTGKEKLVIRTRNVALGVRGTEFIVSSENQTGGVSLVTLEGSVAMARLERGGSPLEALRGPGAVNVATGNYSIFHSGLERPSRPRQMPGRQLEQLKKNEASLPVFNKQGVPHRTENILSPLGKRDGQSVSAAPSPGLSGAPGEMKRSRPGIPSRRGEAPFDGMAAPPAKDIGAGKAPDPKLAPKAKRPGRGLGIPNGSHIPPPAGAPAGTGGLTGPISPSNPTTAPGAPTGPQEPGTLPPPPKGSLPPLPPPPPPPL